MVKKSIEGAGAAGTSEIEEREEMIDRPYELRDLKDADLFPLLNILKKIGVKDFKNAFDQSVGGEKKIRDIGILVAVDMADILIGNFARVEEEVYALWSDISGIPAEKIREMEFGTLPLMIMDTFSKARNTSFFKVLSKLL